ncbi:PulJ/GspJ family protein [Poseidonibacter lekithochrous]|uniref:PulJ/GspJ family protein n=1 Tax=Poseidonibacter lekithochrous TaxID=1904463 RepID=UPI000D3C6DC4|nr:prepilin-type N-terminal cleavage/methylation domain-containing protein [Poseidonibacter lekithochrous]
MKKAFSLMEVLVAITMLSVVMISLLQVKSDNIFLIQKSEEKAELNDYVSLVMNLEEASDRNENIFLDRVYRFDNDELRKELKPIKIKIKDNEISSKLIKNDTYDLNITTYSTTYNIDDKINKNIYTFKIEL